MKRSIIGFMAACIIATGCNAAQKTDEFTTKSGKTVKITCIKHASLEITYDGVEIQIDPVGVGAKPETDYGQFPKANLILITHEHRDHFEREAIAQIRTPATTVYSNTAVYNMFRNCIALANGDSVAYRDDITLKVVPAYNYSEGRTQFHPKGRDNGYILTIDGLRIYIAGDTEDIPEMAEIKDIDIAFLPCNQPYTMTIDQLVKAAKTIKPKVLFPYHYSETPIQQAVMKLGGSGIDVRIRDYK
ncbi:MAG: MBL fold metallo-hydrolase [Prevotella sp.]|nr:MBL fold metallo-hydrolase [Prevotella sp.]MBQ9261453.1 MBL fold metallo-hydrolase [Prevotella sp.]